MLQGNRQKQANHDVEVYGENHVKRILETCGIDVVDEHDDWIDIFCPYHNNTRTRSAGVNKESGAFHCFSCSVKVSLTELVMHVSGRSFFESQRLISSKQPKINILDFVEKTINKQEFEEYDAKQIERFHNNLMEESSAIEYLKNRGISKQSAEYYNLGYSIAKNMVIIPIHSTTGICMGFVARSIGSDKSYINSPGLKRSKTMFNIHRNKNYSEIYIVESSFDAMILEQAGYKAIASMGASISKGQIELIKKYFNNVNVIPDADDAGKEMDRKIKSMIPYSNTIHLPSEYKDVSDMGEEKVKQYMSNIDLISI